MMPTHPRAYFVVVEAHLAFGHPEDLLDVVPMGGDADKAFGIERRAFGSEEVPDLCVVDGAHDEKSFLTRWCSIAFGNDTGAEGKNLDRSLIPIAHGDSLPLVSTPSLLPVLDLAPFRLASWPRRRSADESVARDLKEVTFAAIGQPIPELCGTAKFIVPNNPRMRHAWTDALEQSITEFPLRLVLDARWNVRLLSSIGILDPALGEIQLRIEKRHATGGRVSQERAHLTVVDFPESAAPLTLDTDGIVALLGESRAVKDEYTVWTSYLLDDVTLHLLAQLCIRPGTLAHEPLQWPPIEIMGVGDRLDRLPLQPAHKSFEIDTEMRSLLRSSQHGLVAAGKTFELPEAIGDVGRVHKFVIDGDGFNRLTLGWHHARIGSRPDHVCDPPVGARRRPNATF